MNYLLDTCVISDFFKKHPNTLKHFQAVAPKQLFVSTISLMEIEFGLSLNAEREAKIRPLWELLLKQINIIAFTAQCGIVSAKIRAILKKRGTPVGYYDVLLAGSALAHDFIFVSSNSHEFARIDHLILENWRT